MWWHTVTHVRGNWRIEWVASTLHTTSEHGVSSITTAGAHTMAASRRLNWRPHADLNGLGPFRRKTKSGFCECAITFQKRSNTRKFLEPCKLFVSPGQKLADTEHAVRCLSPVITWMASRLKDPRRKSEGKSLLPCLLVLDRWIMCIAQTMPWERSYVCVPKRN